MVFNRTCLKNYKPTIHEEQFLFGVLLFMIFTIQTLVNTWKNKLSKLQPNPTISGGEQIHRLRLCKRVFFTENLHWPYF